MRWRGATAGLRPTSWTPAGHYLRAVILQELGNHEAARGALQRAIYLCTDLIPAHFASGNLARTMGRAEEANRHFANTLELLRSRPLDEALPESDGLTAGRLTEIIQSLFGDPNPTVSLQYDDPQQILRARARALARRPERPPDAALMLDLLEFRLAQECYALENCYVLEVQPLKELTPLPCTPPFVRGIVNVRGRIVPVIDLKKFFDLPEQGVTDLHRIIFVRGHDLELGLLADVVVGVRLLPVESLAPIVADAERHSWRLSERRDRRAAGGARSGAHPGRSKNRRGGRSGLPSSAIRTTQFD